MKYFFDCEFIEGFHKPVFGKRRHFIDLISIGIVCEDGREYYAISNEFNPKDADDWVRKNVISKLPSKKVNYNPMGGDSPRIVSESKLYKSNKAIASDIISFCRGGLIGRTIGIKERHLGAPSVPKEYGDEVVRSNPIFYGYYSDYDWVLFCSLFGRMIDLPKGYPMYCIDLKQRLDEWVDGLRNSDFFHAFHIEKPLSFEEKLYLVKTANARYPSQEDEHNALSDARWIRKLYDFIEDSKLVCVEEK